MSATRREGIVVLDFGSQYTHLIVRRIREQGVFGEILPFRTPVHELQQRSVRGVVLSGGPRSVYEPGSPQLPTGFLEWQDAARFPVLGICYGMHLMAQALGGKVAQVAAREYGLQTLKVAQRSQLLAKLQAVESVWMSHGDQVHEPPAGFRTTAFSETCPVAAFEDGQRRLFGVQFHPEVHHTKCGTDIIRTFLFDICHCQGTWRMADFVAATVTELKGTVGADRVLMGVSGGVDSTVAALLVQKAVGDHLHCVFVDNGLLRTGEVQQVRSELAPLFLNFHVVDAAETFLKRLRGVTDPEGKRRVIASTFVEVFQHTASQLASQYGAFTYLGQGTIAPDRIETGATSSVSSRIKSHHNVTLSASLHLRLVEPLAPLYKDEVREVGRQLGLPESFVRRHPFPGPALAIRILGPVTAERLRIVRAADAIVAEELIRAGIYDHLWQGFAVFLPVKSVGVKGDTRTYENAVALRIVESQDAMTARMARLDWTLLEHIATRIINEVRGVNRVLYDLSNKPPATIEFL